MTPTIISLAALPCAIVGAVLATGAADAAMAAAWLAPALLGLLLGCAGLRLRGAAAERERSLERQLAAECEARLLSEQALVASHQALCRALLQRRSQGGHAPVPGVRGTTGGLRHALECCLAEHAQLYGQRYRFEAGVDPAAGPVGRAARLAVFAVLQEALAANTGRNGDADLHVRLSEGAHTLALDIQAGALPGRVAAALPSDLAERVRALGGVLRLAAAPGRPSHWSLSLPAGTLATDTQSLA